MNRRKKTSFTINRLISLSLILVGIGLCTWYFFIRPNSQEATGLQPLPQGFSSHGIDVSHYQGKIDWEVFLEEMDTTVSFVYCKVTEGTTFIDSQWERNNTQLSHSNVKHGGYHFFTPDVSATSQANHFLRNYLPTNASLPPVLDAEVEASTDQALITGMREWLKIVKEKTGIRPVIYTSYSLYRDKMKGKFPGYQFWIASYNPDDSRVQNPEIIHWQYSDHGTVPGIDGMVDLNFSKQSFRPAIEFAE